MRAGMKHTGPQRRGVKVVTRTTGGALPPVKVTKRVTGGNNPAMALDKLSRSKHPRKGY